MVYTCTLLPTLSLELNVEMPGPCTSTDDFFCRNLRTKKIILFICNSQKIINNMCLGKHFRLKMESHKIIFTSSLHGFHRCRGLMSPSPIVKPAISLSRLYLLNKHIACFSVTGDETLAKRSVCLHLKVKIKKKNHNMSVNSNPTACQ
jgi:hypothetical protein